MIEILGYIFLYLIVGVLLLPITAMIDKCLDTQQNRIALAANLLVWPALIIIGGTGALLIIWIDGWSELENYK